MTTGMKQVPGELLSIKNRLFCKITELLHPLSVYQMLAEDPETMLQLL
jgi:hypothetical protein